MLIRILLRPYKAKHKSQGILVSPPTDAFENQDKRVNVYIGIEVCRYHIMWKRRGNHFTKVVQWKRDSLTADLL